MPERLQKILSQWGVASRRQAEKLIVERRVRLNGSIAQLGQSVDPQQDQIEVDGVLIQPGDRPTLIYLLLNKPAGYVSTCYDPQQRSTIIDLLPPELQQRKGIHPVGRLDFASTGALLLTNDGELTFLLTHPRHQIAKTYQVWVEGVLTIATLQQWQNGINLDGKQTLPAKVRLLQQKGKAQTLLEIVLREGRNRQIRRVAEQLGHPVLALHRLAIGSICLQPVGAASLPSGCYRMLTPGEVNSLKTQVDITSNKA